jgi:hemoglobin-like flavoprotein
LNADLVSDSLELVAERCGDPTPLVYARLFAAFPETEALFVRDANGAVRGEMLSMAFQCLLDVDGPYGANLIRAERVNHMGLEVPPEAFVQFFPVVMQTCRQVLGQEWTPDIDAAWAERLAKLDAIIASAA